MQLPYSALPDRIPGVAYTLAGIVVATVVITKLSKTSKLDVIPTVGPSNRLELLWAGFRKQMNIVEIIQGGYKKYKSAPFKIVGRSGWVVILGGRKHIDEIRSASEDTLSLQAVANEEQLLKYTMGPELTYSSYHNDIIRSQLNRSLSSLYPEIRDEVSVSFDDVLDLKDSEWKSVRVLDAIQKVVCRTSNRVFVGLPLCQDPDWIDINLRYTRDIYEGVKTIRRFPRFLSPLVTRFMTNVPRTQKRAIKHLSPIIEEQLKVEKERGNDWPGKPNNVLSWMMDQAPEGPERTNRVWTIRILSTNVAAIHTTSNSFYKALFFLAGNTQYIQPLREEVDSIVEKEGWSKASLGKMRKVDSFLRVCQRLAGIGILTVRRKALRDFTFSDGTFIPKGTVVAAPSLCLHLDNEHYDNAHIFDPFRFSDMRDEDGEGSKYQLVSTSTEYLPFGYGKNACPGRFFAASELKTMLAHVVVSYDLKLEDDKSKPNELTNGFTLLGNPAAKIMFRRRIR